MQMELKVDVKIIISNENEILMLYQDLENIYEYFKINEHKPNCYTELMRLRGALGVALQAIQKQINTD